MPTIYPLLPAAVSSRTTVPAGRSFPALCSGAIDFTQPYGNVPDNYKMQFAGCGAGGRQLTFDVRWNVQTVTANTRLITVAARPLGATGSNRPAQFAQPVTLRTIGGT